MWFILFVLRLDWNHSMIAKLLPGTCVASLTNSLTLTRSAAKPVKTRASKCTHVIICLSRVRTSNLTRSRFTSLISSIQAYLHLSQPPSPRLAAQRFQQSTAHCRIESMLGWKYNWICADVYAVALDLGRGGALATMNGP